MLDKDNLNVSALNPDIRAQQTKAAASREIEKLRHNTERNRECWSACDGGTKMCCSDNTQKETHRKETEERQQCVTVDKAQTSTSE